MSKADIFDDQLRSWLQDHAQAEIPTGIRDRALPVTIGRLPRPGAVAAIGSHWVAEAPSATRQALRPLLALVAIVVALALLGTVLFTAARRPTPQPSPQPTLGDGGRLLYDRDGDIVLAYADGTGARVLIDGAPSADPTGAYFTLVPEVWAPDGEHFVYFEYGPTGVITHVADATGQTVGTWTNPPPSNRSFGPPRVPTRDTKATNVLTWWSPDSTMLATFPWTATEVTIYGIDGQVVTTVPLPNDLEMFREVGLSGWTPDGGALLANITSRARGLRHEVWELPLDGTPGRQVLDGDPFVDPEWALSPDGQQLAFRGHVRLDGSNRFAASPFEGVDTIYVADADGMNQQPIGATHTGGIGAPQWSPDGMRIMFTVLRGRGYRYDIFVVDARGVETLVAKMLTDDWAPLVWSPDGESILVGAFVVEPAIGGPRPSQLGTGTSHPGGALVSLWKVDVDGTKIEQIAEGLNYFGIAP